MRLSQAGRLVLPSAGALPANATLDLILGLPPRNTRNLDATIEQIYNPASPRYRHFLTPAEYNASYAPSAADFRKLLAFVSRSHFVVVATAPNHKFVHVRASAATVNSVFHTTITQYHHPLENRLYYAPSVKPIVDYDGPILQVSGLDNFQLPTHKTSSGQPAAPAGGPTPGPQPPGTFAGADYRAAYAPGTSLDGSGQTLGILQENGYNASDIALYEKVEGLPNVKIQNVYLDGYKNDSPVAESALDIEAAISMAPGVSQITVYGFPYPSGVEDALHEMADPSKGEPLPSQISTSFGIYYNKNIYDELRRFVAQGQTFFVFSGDFGSFNETTDQGAFPPTDDPNTTSVGATELTTKAPGGQWASETAASFSGGGFSSNAVGDAEFKIPAWQTGTDFSTSEASTTARNAPDVSMVGDNIAIIFNGSWEVVAGTSASTPLWAGFMALVNEQAVNSGKPQVGFASPALWAAGQHCSGCFHDITVGNNFNATNPAKYKAGPGYDLVTGWGSPDGSTLIDALVNGVSGCVVRSQPTVIYQYVLFGATLENPNTLTLRMKATTTGLNGTPTFTWKLTWPGGAVQSLDPTAQSVILKFPNFKHWEIPNSQLGALTLAAAADCNMSASTTGGLFLTYEALGRTPPQPKPHPLQPKQPSKARRATSTAPRGLRPMRESAVGRPSAFACCLRTDSADGRYQPGPVTTAGGFLILVVGPSVCAARKPAVPRPPASVGVQMKSMSIPPIDFELCIVQTKG